ncbi:MAG TPA: copper resistance protein CopC, partial [Rugosimonospora sp.]|nr:copper resistance protein CopC [Rugosimonospora sp.]
MRSLIRLGTVAAALLAWLLATAGAATAHAQLLATSPAPDQHLARPPAEVTLRFDEPVHPVRGAVRLLDSAGRTV